MPLSAFYNGFSERMPVWYASTPAQGHPVSHATDGWLHTYYRAAAPGDVGFGWDSGPGHLLSFNTLIVAGLAGLMGRQLVVYAGDGTTWSSAPLNINPVISAHLLPPDYRHGLFECPTIQARAFALSVNALGQPAPMQATELWLGTRFEFPAGVIYPARLGPRRAFRGMSMEFEWVTTDEANAGAIVDYLGAVSPDYPQEQPLETIGGNVLGARPHWLYDPTGAVFRHQNTPTPFLLPVMLMSPGEVGDESLIRGLRRGMRATYRERR